MPKDSVKGECEDARRRNALSINIRLAAQCTTTHTTEIESIFFLQILVSEVLDYIFTRSAHAGITFSLQSIVLVLVSTFTHYHFVFVFVEPYLMRGVKFLEKLCNIG